MENITVLFALVAGLISFFSPCIFPLIPAYVTHLTGTSIDQNRVNVEPKNLYIRSVSFIIGFSIVFVMMGATASFIGQFFYAYRDLIQKLSGLLIIVFGLQMAGLISMKFLLREKRMELKQKKRNVFHSFLLGFAFGTGWTPCVGLALSSILLIAGSSSTVYTGMVLLWVYSLGLGIPFLIISILITYSLKWVKRINKYLPKLAVVNGLILVAMGLLLFTGQMQQISSWLAQFTF